MNNTATAMTDNPEFLAFLSQIVEEKIPFCKLLGIQVEALDADRPRLRLCMREDLLGNFSQGMLHGGVIASVLDSIAGVAILLQMAKQQPRADVMSQLAEFAQMSTIDLRIDYLKPGKGKYFIASAEVTRLGKRVANVLMDMRNDRDERIATGAAAFMLHGRA